MSAADAASRSAVTQGVERHRGRSRLPDVLGVLWVLGAAVATMLPALQHGVYLGTYDALSRHGLSMRAGVKIHNPSASDQISAIIPWTTLAWTQVHHGQLPLWNPYNGTGMPLAFNWQSAPFSVQAAIGYLFPVRFAYTVGVLITLAVAGTGAYVLARVLHLGVLAAATAGTVFELSGTMFGFLGWPHAAVMAWAGWVFAAALVVVRGRSRWGAIALLALTLALAVYAGQPEVLAALGLSLVLFLGVFLGLRVVLPGGSGPILRPVVDLAIAAIAGVALAAPLALPGLQLAAGSVRGTSGPARGLPLHDLAYLISQGYDGLPFPGSEAFGRSYFYGETAAYVGVVALVLALTAVVVRRRRPEVLAFAVVAVVAGAVVFVPGLASFASALPAIGKVQWLRALMPMAFTVSILAAVGMDLVVRSPRRRAVLWSAGAGFALSAVVVLAFFLGGRGGLTPLQWSLRARSLIWPAALSALGLAVVGCLWLVRGRRADVEARSRAAGVPARRIPRFARGAGRWAGLVLLAGETAFLVAAGAPVWASSARPLTPTASEVALRRAVGSSVVGFGTGCDQLGIVPNVNDAFAVRELSLYDPMTPRDYFRAWTKATGTSPGLSNFNLFCPQVTTAAVARLYGVSFVLEPGGRPGPAGTTYDGKIGDESLYRVPGAALATLTPTYPGGVLPPDTAPGRPVAVTQPDPATLELTTSSARPQVLRLRLTDVPGWHASIDGRPLPLSPYATVMLQARIPPGRHTVVVRYWPTTFTAGIALALLAVVGLSTAVIGSAVGRRRRTTT